jgi:hypothetical protein
MTRTKLKFSITYFTARGTEFALAEYEYACSDGRQMQSIAAHIRGLADDDSQESGLPGFGGDYWEGPILIQNDAYGSVLVFPKKRGRGYSVKGLKEAFK